MRRKIVLIEELRVVAFREAGGGLAFEPKRC
jgi:hypothetical protein